MSTDDSRRASADLQLLDAQVEKTRAETTAIQRAAEREKHRLGGFVIEGIKVFGAIVIGIGGAVAGFSGYQLSEAKKERYELEAAKAQQQLDKTQSEEKATKQQLEAARAELDAKKLASAAMDKDLTATRVALDQLRADLSKAKSLGNSPATVAALDSATASATQLSDRLASVSNSAGDIQRSTTGEKLYYVIALTSATRESAESEVGRVRQSLGQAFDSKFPTIEVYGPDAGPYTILVSRQALPFGQASQLKQQAIDAGFSKQTWLWQSTVSYFDQKKQRN